MSLRLQGFEKGIEDLPELEEITLSPPGVSEALDLSLSFHLKAHNP
jgi:hypothetical protein